METKEVFASQKKPKYLQSVGIGRDVIAKVYMHDNIKFKNFFARYSFLFRTRTFATTVFSVSKEFCSILSNQDFWRDKCFQDFQFFKFLESEYHEKVDWQFVYKLKYTQATNGLYLLKKAVNDMQVVDLEELEDQYRINKNWSYIFPLNPIPTLLGFGLFFTTYEDEDEIPLMKFIYLLESTLFVAVTCEENKNEGFFKMSVHGNIVNLEGDIVQFNSEFEISNRRAKGSFRFGIPTGFSEFGVAGEEIELCDERSKLLFDKYLGLPPNRLASVRLAAIIAGSHADHVTKITNELTHKLSKNGYDFDC